jgi:glycosyltransferase involved in cell wall biosynthesis
MRTRILQVANFYSRHSGGLRTTVDALGSAYVDAGFERVLVVPGAADADEDTPAGRRITLRGPQVPGMGGYRALAGSGGVRAVLAELPPDHLEVSDKLTLVGLGTWAARNGVRAVLVSHERLDAILTPRVPPGFPLAMCADWWNRRLARGFDAVVTPSAFAAAEFIRIGASNVTVIPLGVDLDVFHPRAREHPVDVDGDDNEVRLVCVGRLSREKRPDVAIETLRAVQERGLAARLWMVGDGPRRRALEAQARALLVVFTGHLHDRDEMARLLARAHVALAPCPYETFGLAALEALACGTPVVATDRGAVSELVQAGQGAATGAVAAPAPASLAAAVVDVVRRPRDEARRAARARAEQYPCARTAREMLRIHRHADAYLSDAQRRSDTHHGAA